MEGAQRPRITERQTATLRAKAFWGIVCVALLAAVPGFVLAGTPQAIWLVLGWFFLCTLVGLFVSAQILSPVLALRRRLEVKNYGEERAEGSNPPLKDDPDSTLDAMQALASFLPSLPVNPDQRLPKELMDIERLARSGRISQMAMLNARKDLFRHLSHQLKNPLAILRAHTATVRAAVAVSDRVEIERGLGEIDAHCLRMSTLIEQLLALAWVDTYEEKGLSGERANVSAAINDLFRLQSSKARSKQIELSSDVEAGLWIKGERHLLHELISALVDNAMRYGPENSEVTVDARRVPGTKTVQVLIGDRGPGVPPHERERVFEPFYGGVGVDEAGRPMFGTRLHRAVAGGEKSHGLGLCIARSIVKLHGGTISLEGQASGPGLVVKILLPLASPPTHD